MFAVAFFGSVATQFAFSTAHRTKSLYLIISLQVTRVWCCIKHRTTPHNTALLIIRFILQYLSRYYTLCILSL